jgi:radial spoke head protein 4A
MDNDEEDEEKEDQEEIEPEIGPPLLTPLTEDAELNGMTPWSAHASSRLMVQFSVAVVHSCLWPGAHTFGSGRSELLY